MDWFSHDISRIVLRPNIRRDMGQISLSAVMLEVLRELDGRRNVLAVSRSLQTPMETLREVLSHLDRLGLILRVEGPREAVDRRFFKELESLLADVMGPMAAVLLKEEIETMGEEPSGFPRDRTAELIDRLGSKIFHEGKKNAFLRAARGL